MRPLIPSSNEPDKDTSGGCAYGCTGLFILAGIIWPLLHLLDGYYEPEIMFIPLVVGGPSFIMANILALISTANFPAGNSRGARALKVIWGLIGLIVIITVFSMIFDKATGRSDRIRADWEVEDASTSPSPHS